MLNVAGSYRPNYRRSRLFPVCLAFVKQHIPKGHGINRVEIVEKICEYWTETGELWASQEDYDHKRVDLTVLDIRMALFHIDYENGRYDP